MDAESYVRKLEEVKFKNKKIHLKKKKNFIKKK
jgi:hypothetical protein